MTNNDIYFNGHFLEVKSEGEIYKKDDAYLVVLDPNTQVGEGYEKPAKYDVNTGIRILTVIASQVSAINREKKIKLTKEAFADIVLLRYISVKYGLMNPNLTKKVIFTCYNQCMFAEKDTDNDPVIKQEAKEIKEFLDDEKFLFGRLAFWADNYMNFVCLLAYMFRVRGHHFVPDMLSKYVNVWKKVCLDNAVIDFETAVTYGLHAICPPVLDAFYKECVDNQRISGALIIRYYSFGAGTAVFGLLQYAVKDLKVAAPFLIDKLKKEVTFVEDTVQNMKDNRWNHTINARLYGANRERVDESQIGALCAVIRGAVESVAEHHPILASEALKRAANQAPLTGGTYVNAYVTFTASKQYVEKLIG
jgi:hypothetical protein